MFLYNSYIIENSEYSKNNKYSLFGIIVHKGKYLNEGHYFSIVSRNKKWYQCNDNKIVELKGYSSNGYIFFDNINKETTDKNGYLFFYRKIYSM